MNRIVYADNAATTAVSTQVLEAMLPYYKEVYGNPSSLYAAGQKAKAALDQARADVAACLGADPDEIYFTSCGTESDNWAIKGAAHAMKKKGKTHIVTSAFEHHAVLHTCQALEKEGFTVTYLPVHENGIVRVEELEAALTEDTGLVTIMYANNEIGTLQPIPQIGKLCREKGIWFHTDAVQAVGQVPIDVREQNIDMLSLSGHKLHAPKGVGALYIRRGVRIPNLLDGGAQERGRRGGTENVAQIAGMGRAVELAMATLEERKEKETRLREYLIDRVLSLVPYTRDNGDRKNRLANNASFAFQFIEGESLLIMLDMAGICGSSGSACTSGSLDPSHVLLAIGLPHEIAHGSLRLTLGEENTKEEMDYVAETIRDVVERLRSMSPLYEDFVKSSKRH